MNTSADESIHQGSVEGQHRLPGENSFKDSPARNRLSSYTTLPHRFQSRLWPLQWLLTLSLSQEYFYSQFYTTVISKFSIFLESLIQN